MQSDRHAMLSEPSGFYMTQGSDLKDKIDQKKRLAILRDQINSARLIAVFLCGYGAYLQIKHVAYEADNIGTPRF